MKEQDNVFPIPLRIRALRHFEPDIQLIFNTCKLPIRRATFSSRRGENHKQQYNIYNSSIWIKTQQS